MGNKLNVILIVFWGLKISIAQIQNGVGLNVNVGTNKRMNISLCYERNFKQNIFFRFNFGYGNLIPFNNNQNTADLYFIRKSEDPDNLAKHLDLLYSGYSFSSQESNITAPELKFGLIWILKRFQFSRSLLSGIYAGYQTSISMVSQSYTNFYVSDSLRSNDILEGRSNYFSWSPINLMAGCKILIASNTTIDIAVEQSLGILFGQDFKYISEFYKNPYSGLQVDFSIGIRQLF